MFNKFRLPFLQNADIFSRILIAVTVCVGVIPSKLVALIIAPVAQLVEQWPFKPLAGGSSPPGRTD